MSMPRPHADQSFGFCARCLPAPPPAHGWELTVLSSREIGAYAGDGNVMHQPQPGRCLRCGGTTLRRAQDAAA